MGSALQEYVFLNDTASTDPSTVINLPPGDWKFSVSGTASDRYNIVIEDSRANANDWRAVTSRGGPLLPASPSKIIRSGGEDYRVTRTDGSNKCTVVATLVPSAMRHP